jgi:hypothetical protein
VIVLDFLKEYWVIITFFFAEIGVIYAFISSVKKAIKSLLRKAILDIYDKCKETKTITLYQKKCINSLYDIYKQFKGNSFVDSIMDEISNYETVE